MPVCAVGDKILQWLVDIDEEICRRVALEVFAQAQRPKAAAARKR